MKHVLFIIILITALQSCKKPKSDESKFTDVIFYVSGFYSGFQDLTLLTVNDSNYSDFSLAYKNGNRIISGFKSSVNNYTGPEGEVGFWEYSENDKILSLTFTKNATNDTNPFWNSNTIKWNVIDIKEDEYLILIVRYPDTPGNDYHLNLVAKR